ncbi:MAG: pentapeptide repeat-containing protein [Actinomadura sp.]
MDFSHREFADADFRNAVFEGRTDFGCAVFHGKADFGGAVFRGRVFFTGAVFEGAADFYEARFERFANFRDVKITGDATFNGAVFADGPLLEATVVDGLLRFSRVEFANISALGPFTAATVDFTHATFHRRLRMDAHTSEIMCDRTRFLGGVNLFAEQAAITLADTELGGPSLIGSQERGSRRPRLVRVAGTDVGQLTASDVDLSRCAFTGAHNLDQLRLNGDHLFSTSPRSLLVSRRSIIWDEHLWRSRWGTPRDRRVWPKVDDPASRDVEPFWTGDVCQAYRALRKGLEDAKDEPGAGDFYYGEMEMRRRGRHLEARVRRRERWWAGWLVSRGEHALLWLYWLLSGYGLRASRAVTALAVLIALAAAVLTAWGFPPDAHVDYTGSVRFSLTAATSFLQGPERRLTATGEWVELVLRFTGPVLFGLTVLALRGRVKR